MSNLYNKIKEYGQSDFYPFHMPGHKRNTILDLPKELTAIDITEISDFDNLHKPEGIIKQIQEEAAMLYGANESFLLVNGSTAGILSAISATVKRGDCLVTARNCHKSVYHGIFLHELDAAFVYPKLFGDFFIPGQCEPSEVEEILIKYSNVGAVIITSPTYEGIVSDVEKIAYIAHRFQKPLIVDEAHGAHFGFHKDFPETAVRLGADIVIQSMHKMLPAMTQTAMLHVNGNLINREKLRFRLRIFQTSSPSYVLMASVDSCMNFMRDTGNKRLNDLLCMRQRFDESMKECHYIRIFNEGCGIDMGMKATDPGKIVIIVDSKWMTGPKLYDMLEDEYHLQLEMAAAQYVLAIVTVMDGETAFQKLQIALQEIDAYIAKKEECVNEEKDLTFNTQWKKQEEPEFVMSIALAEEAENELVSLAEGSGRVAAAFINLYPPGIPMIVPGEKFNNKLIIEIQNLISMGLNVQGILLDNHIKVVKKEKRIR